MGGSISGDWSVCEIPGRCVAVPANDGGCGDGMAAGTVEMGVVSGAVEMAEAGVGVVVLVTLATKCGCWFRTS